eukprot:COSAG01_NODE_18294_length_1085_cov_1.332320_2_plen_52_part_01
MLLPTSPGGVSLGLQPPHPLSQRAQLLLLLHPTHLPPPAAAAAAAAAVAGCC